MKNFDQYAITSNLKIEDKLSAALNQNRIKAFQKSYLPLKKEIANATQILDFGCGSGEFIDFLATQNRTAQIVGYDLSPTQIQAAQRRLSKHQKTNSIRLVQSSSEIQSQFDLIFSLHVVEHIPDSELADYFKSMLSLLKPSGSLIVSTPNGLNPFSYAYSMSTDSTHRRMHSPITINELTHPFGYEVREVFHETPVAYDFMTTLKFIAWKLSSFFVSFFMMTVAPGIRGLKFPNISSASFFCRIKPIQR